MFKINEDTWGTYQPGCSRECLVCLMGAVYFCPCRQPGLEGSHSAGSVCAARRGNGKSVNNRKKDNGFFFLLIMSLQRYYLLK